jgi:hypothetical protein
MPRRQAKALPSQPDKEAAEAVVILLVQQRDVDWNAGEGFGGFQAREASTHDYDPRRCRHLFGPAYSRNDDQPASQLSLRARKKPRG